MAFSSKICSISLVFTIAMLVNFTEAKDHLVSWNVNSSDANSLNTWSQKSRFNIGDNLVWKYDNKNDSVLQVTREAYLTCNTTNPIAEVKNGENKVVLDKAGSHYFISGLKDNCDKGEKVLVVVITPRNRRSGAVSPALAPSPDVLFGSPAVAPSLNSGVSGVKGGLMLVFVGVLVGLVLV